MKVFYDFFNKPIDSILQKVGIILTVLCIMFTIPSWGAQKYESETIHGGDGSGRRVIRILTVDGRGVRGIIPATVLEGIEEKLRAKNKNVQLAQYFDIMSGTSTGGIIVLGLNAGKSAEDLSKLYLNKGDKIFPTPGRFNFGATGPKYDATPLEHIFKEELGDVWLKNAVSHIVIPADNMGQQCAYLFDSDQAKQLKSHNFLMRDVARATSAAPTYFSAATIKDEKGMDEHTFTDGETYANDPTFEAIQAAEKKFPRCDFFIVSLGTGETPRKFGDLSLKDGGVIKWAAEIANNLMKNTQDRHLNVLEGLKSLMAKQGRTVNYHRIQVNIPLSIAALDDAGKIKNLREAGKYLLNPLNPERKAAEIENIVQELHKYYEEYDEQIL